MAQFWFKCGLNYLERKMPDRMDRHLVTLANFY